MLTLLLLKALLLAGFGFKHLLAGAAVVLKAKSLATFYYPGCKSLPTPNCTECPTKELAGVRGIWMQKVGFSFLDIEDPNEWATNICNGNVILFPLCNGEVAIDPKMSEGYGNVLEDVDSYTYSLKVNEPNYHENVPFWNEAKRSNQYLVGYKTGSQIHLSSVPAKFVPTTPVARGKTDKIDINLMIKFVQVDLLVPMSAPPGTFDQCEAC